MRVKLCRDLLNIYSPLIHDNEQTDTFYFRQRRGAVRRRGESGIDEKIREKLKRRKSKKVSLRDLGLTWALK